MAKTTKAAANNGAWPTRPVTALLVLADGTVIEGFGLGATGQAVGEVCFNTAMTGYQEILTDPSYAGQIITFTFPHIGNVGTNAEDTETSNLAARSGVRGAVLKADITLPVELPLGRDARQMAGGAWHRRSRRHRHAGADRPHPREGHAERRHRARSRGQVRSRPALKARRNGLARPRRHGPGQGRDGRPELWLGRDAMALGLGLWAGERPAVVGRRRRLRHQAQHPALPRRRPAAM